ncbi:hypothetical protein [Sphingobacterium cellulitidis]|uniref:Uncharacterized protein n=1 Tax=Sphingobacterium cellulitidis TaxID=1768011 RepID=A0A8H9G169_9SPHI|nr:hypothetical protein [Sphingobacterium soli]MBA8986666.1 hypothetical protein [Sphingobacterium soli]GGE27479.1 hypothetical protein GCM10011516_26410 [Sphingobacterium soli]
MKNYLILFLCIGFFSCQNNNQQKKQDPLDTLANTDFDKSPIGKEVGCKWLKDSIESYFNNNASLEGMQVLTTPDYYNFKLDAMNTGLDIDSSITEFELRQKWKSKFDIDSISLGHGFLISAQDWGKIQVSGCELLNENAQELDLKVIISDCQFQTDYHRDIKLVMENNQIKIANVKEYD